MNSKIVFLLFAACLTNQATASSIPKITSTIDNVIEIAEKILLFVNQVIDEVVSGISDLINEDMDLLDEIRDKGLSFTEKLIEREMELVDQLIDAAKKRANESSLDILECAQSVETEVAAVAQQTLNLSVSCIDNTVKDASLVLLQILDDVKNVNTDFKKIEEKLEGCKGHLIPIPCITKVIDELGEIAATVPAKAREEGRKAEQAMTDFERALEKCSTDTADAAQEGNILVFNDFSQCVWDKEHNTTLFK